MARRLRFVPAGALVEVSARTVQGRHLMTPTKQVTEIILGILGRAQARYNMVIHAFQFLSDHYHMLLSPDDAEQLAGFMCFVNGNIAREVGRLARWRDKFWSRRYTSIIVSRETAAQEARLKYLLANGCKEGLVASPRDWTGASVATTLLRGGTTMRGKWFDRSKEYRSSLSGKRQAYVHVETVTISPLPCWVNLNPWEIGEKVLAMTHKIEAETSSRHASLGTTPLGVQKVLKKDRLCVPKNMKRTPAPLFIAATLHAMQELVAAYNDFVASFRTAAEKLRTGHLDVVFPPGSFPPRGAYVPLVAPG